MRLGKWHRWTIYSALIIVAASGLFWFILHDFAEEEPGALQRTTLIIHGVSAFATLIVVGSVLPLHVKASWLGKRNIATGVSLLSVMAILIVTALCLYYGGEDTRIVARWTHIAIGLLAFGTVPIHVLFGRKARREAFAPRSRPVARSRSPQSAHLSGSSH